MTTGRRGLVLAAGAAGLMAGCVDRRFVVETNVPGAQIAVDGVPIGPSPTDGRWEYAGCYEFTAVAPGHEPLVQTVRFAPKWYQYPPFDFIAEVLYPFRIEDVRRVRLRLEPTRPVNQAALVAAGDALRARGATLPPSSVPDDAQQRPAGRPGTPTPTPPMTGAPFPGTPSSPNSDPLGIPPAVQPGGVRQQPDSVPPPPQVAP